MQACNDSNGHFCSAVYLADKGEYTALQDPQTCMHKTSKRICDHVIFLAHHTHTTHMLTQVCKECNREGWRGKEAKKGGDRIEIIYCGIVCRGVVVCA